MRKARMHVICQLLIIIFRLNVVEQKLLTGGVFFMLTDDNAQENQIVENDVIQSNFHMQCSQEKNCKYLARKNSQDFKNLSKENFASLRNSKFTETWEKRFSSAKVYRDCKEAYDDGINESGERKIFWKNGSYFKAFCDMKTDGGGWTVFQRRRGIVLDFQRKWNECKVGFGDFKHSFWLGLTAVYQLTRRSNNTLRIELKDINGHVGFAHFSDFRVASGKKNYRLHLKYRFGNIGKALQQNNGMNFTTIDRDNDNEKSSNLANLTGGPWWHKKVTPTNLNNIPAVASTFGILVSPIHDDKMMKWGRWSQGRIVNSEMKFRRVD